MQKTEEENQVVLQVKQTEDEQSKRQYTLFDTIIYRMHSHCLKYDAISIFFPEYQNPDEVSCNWVGDMDFNVCPYITEGLQQRIKTNHIYGNQIHSYQQLFQGD